VAAGAQAGAGTAIGLERWGWGRPGRLAPAYGEEATIYTLPLRLAALRAELDASRNLAAAFGAELFCRQRSATLGTELAAADGGTAPGTAGYNDCVKILRGYFLASCDMGDLACGLDGGLGLHRRHLDGQIGSAILAQAAFLVPALLHAHPGATAGALPEIGLDLLDGLGKGRIVGSFPRCRVDSVAHIGSPAQDAAQQAAGDVQCLPGDARRRGPERSAVASPATVAVELELEAAFGAFVVVVAHKLDQGHFSPPHLAVGRPRSQDVQTHLVGWGWMGHCISPGH